MYREGGWFTLLREWSPATAEPREAGLAGGGSRTRGGPGELPWDGWHSVVAGQREEDLDSLNTSAGGGEWLGGSGDTGEGAGWVGNAAPGFQSAGNK